MKIEPAISAEQLELTEVVDLVVVGFGGAGASAAIAAAEGGAEVLIIERTSGGGGSTAMSGGFMYLGGGTPPQLANGFRDTPENMARFIKAVQPKASPDKVDAYAQGSVEHYNWMMSLGVPFNEQFYPGKHFHPSSDETLVWTGSEACWPFDEAAEPMPRGHKPEEGEALPGGAPGFVGYMLFERFLNRVTELGIKVIYDAAVNALVTDGSGAVVGAQYRKEGRNMAVGARKGVLLATGGAEWNREMAEKAKAKITMEGVDPLGVSTADGSGIELGASVGGAVSNMDEFIITAPFYPPESLIKGILVNSEGKRFVAEDVYHARSTLAVLDQPGAKAYLICDNPHFGRPELGLIRSERKHDVVGAWDNFAEMEADLGMPRGSLVTTIENYNRFAATGVDEEFRKSAKWMAPIAEAPFAAIDCSLGAAYYAGLSLGGLETNVDGQVLDAQGKPIPGLYAAGQMAPTITVEGAGYASGFLIGAGTFFGRRAGAAIARAQPMRIGARQPAA